MQLYSADSLISSRDSSSRIRGAWRGDTPGTRNASVTQVSRRHANPILPLRVCNITADVEPRLPVISRSELSVLVLPREPAPDPLARALRSLYVSDFKYTRGGPEYFFRGKFIRGRLGVLALVNHFRICCFRCASVQNAFTYVHVTRSHTPRLPHTTSDAPVRVSCGLAARC